MFNNTKQKGNHFCEENSIKTLSLCPPVFFLCNDPKAHSELYEKETTIFLGGELNDIIQIRAEHFFVENLRRHIFLSYLVLVFGQFTAPR